MAGLRFVHLRSLVVRVLLAISIICVLFYLVRRAPSLQRPRVALHRDQPLLNLTNFHLVLSADACHPAEEVKALLLITSHVANTHGRMAWRNGMPTKVRL
jgi:hypothetical protein